MRFRVSIVTFLLAALAIAPASADPLVPAAPALTAAVTSRVADWLTPRPARIASSLDIEALKTMISGMEIHGKGGWICSPSGSGRHSSCHRR